MKRTVVTRMGLLAGLVAVALVPGAAQALGPPLAAAPSEQDTQYLRTIHQVDLAAVGVGELAQDKQNANQQVKDLGGRMVTDHTRLDKEVQRVAGEVEVNLPDTPTDQQQELRRQLKAMDGAEFDALLVSTGLAGYARAIEVNNAEIAQGSDERVTALAQEAAPVLTALFEALRNLAASLGLPTSPSPTAPGQTGTPTPTVSPTLPSPTLSPEPVEPQTPLPAQS